MKLPGSDRVGIRAGLTVGNPCYWPMLSLVFVKTILKPTNYLRKFWVGFFYSLPDVALILKHLTLFCLQKVLLSYLLLQILGNPENLKVPIPRCWFLPLVLRVRLLCFRVFVPLCGFCAHSDLNRRSPIVLEFRCVHLCGFSTMWGSRLSLSTWSWSLTQVPFRWPFLLIMFRHWFRICSIGA